MHLGRQVARNWRSNWTSLRLIQRGVSDLSKIKSRPEPNFKLISEVQIPTVEFLEGRAKPEDVKEIMSQDSQKDTAPEKAEIVEEEAALSPIEQVAEKFAPVVDAVELDRKTLRMMGKPENMIPAEAGPEFHILRTALSQHGFWALADPQMSALLSPEHQRRMKLVFETMEDLLHEPIDPKKVRNEDAEAGVELLGCGYQPTRFGDWASMKGRCSDF